MKLIGELIELISRRAGLENVGEVGQSLKKTGRRSSDDTPPGRSPEEQVRDLLDVIGSDLLDFGQLVIAGMTRTTGKGSPDTGTSFGHGHNGFNKAGATQAEHPQGAGAAPGETGRAPVGAETDSDPDGPQAPVTVRLNPDTSPGPSAGMSPQDTKLGEGVHVRG